MNKEYIFQFGQILNPLNGDCLVQSGKNIFGTDWIFSPVDWPAVCSLVSSDVGIYILHWQSISDSRHVNSLQVGLSRHWPAVVSWLLMQQRPGGPDSEKSPIKSLSFDLVCKRCYKINVTQPNHVNTAVYKADVTPPHLAYWETTTPQGPARL